MKKTLITLILLTCVAQAWGQDYRLVWSDEFNYKGLPDTNKWGNEVGFIRNNELQYYTRQRIENSVVKDGKLLIIGRKEKFKDANYTSASLVTDKKFSWTYGKVEAMIKLPVGQGIWPAFWMLGQSIHEIGWPKCGEIDIMEHINNETIAHGTLHWHNEKHVQSGATIQCDVTKYHLYTVEWDKDAIKWFLDGTKYHEVEVKDGVNSTEEFHKPHYIILNLAIGGAWPKDPDATSQFPDTMYVDYVRVYQKSLK
jgi:beta-glucanase (GH16 family)